MSEPSDKTQMKVTETAPDGTVTETKHYQPRRHGVTGTSFSNIKIDLSKVVSGAAIVAAGLLGWYTNAVAGDIDDVAVLVKEQAANATKITTAVTANTAAIGLIVQVQQQQQKTVEKAIEVADENHDALIRIQTEMKIVIPQRVTQ